MSEDGAEVDAVDVAREDLAAGGEAPAVVVDPEAEPMGGLAHFERAAAHGPDHRPGLGGGALRHRRVEGDHAGGRGVRVAVSTLWRFFDRRRITLKKTAHAAEQERPDVKARWLAWFEAQPELDPSHQMGAGHRPLRHQHVDLPQLCDDLLGLVLSLRHSWHPPKA